MTRQRRDISKKEYHVRFVFIFFIRFAATRFLDNGSTYLCLSGILAECVLIMGAEDSSSALVVYAQFIDKYSSI